MFKPYRNPVEKQFIQSIHGKVPFEIIDAWAERDQISTTNPPSPLNNHALHAIMKLYLDQQDPKNTIHPSIAHTCFELIQDSIPTLNQLDAAIILKIISKLSDPPPDHLYHQILRKCFFPSNRRTSQANDHDPLPLKSQAIAATLALESLSSLVNQSHSLIELRKSKNQFKNDISKFSYVIFSATSHLNIATLARASLALSVFYSSGFEFECFRSLQAICDRIISLHAKSQAAPSLDHLDASKKTPIPIVQDPELYHDSWTVPCFLKVIRAYALCKALPDPKRVELYTALQHVFEENKLELSLYNLAVVVNSTARALERQGAAYTLDSHSDGLSASSDRLVSILVSALDQSAYEMSQLSNVAATRQSMIESCSIIAASCAMVGVLHEEYFHHLTRAIVNDGLLEQRHDDFGAVMSLSPQTFAMLFSAYCKLQLLSDPAIEVLRAKSLGILMLDGQGTVVVGWPELLSIFTSNSKCGSSHQGSSRLRDELLKACCRHAHRLLDAENLHMKRTGRSRRRVRPAVAVKRSEEGELSMGDLISFGLARPVASASRFDRMAAISFALIRGGTSRVDPALVDRLAKSCTGELMDIEGSQYNIALSSMSNAAAAFSEVLEEEGGSDTIVRGCIAALARKIVSDYDALSLREGGLSVTMACRLCIAFSMLNEVGSSAYVYRSVELCLESVLLLSRELLDGMSVVQLNQLVGAAVRVGMKNDSDVMLALGDLLSQRRGR